MKRRHCSVCNSTAHDARKHRRKRIRRNPSPADMSQRLTSGRMRGQAAMDAVRQYQRATKRNPGPMTDAEERQRAIDQAVAFHGSAGRGQVVELEPAERRHSKYAVVLGRLPALTYAPPKGSSRGAYLWSHKSGDYGDGHKRGHANPVLAADVITGEPMILLDKSGMKFDPNRGLVG